MLERRILRPVIAGAAVAVEQYFFHDDPSSYIRSQVKDAAPQDLLIENSCKRLAAAGVQMCDIHEIFAFIREGPGIVKNPEAASTD